MSLAAHLWCYRYRSPLHQSSLSLLPRGMVIIRTRSSLRSASCPCRLPPSRFEPCQGQVPGLASNSSQLASELCVILTFFAGSYLKKTVSFRENKSAGLDGLPSATTSDLQKSSLVQLILPKNTKKHHCGKQQQKNVTFRTILTGLSVLLLGGIQKKFLRIQNRSLSANRGQMQI